MEWFPGIRSCGTCLRRSNTSGDCRRHGACAGGLAAAGMAATNGPKGGAAPGPNGCPTNKSAKTAPIADLAPPARLQIEAFDVLSGPVNERTNTFTLKVRVGSTCSVNIKGASVYVTAVPYNQFSIPEEELTGDDGTAKLVFQPRRELPGEQPAAAAHALHPRDEAGRGPARRRSTRRLVVFVLRLVDGPAYIRSRHESPRGATVASLMAMSGEPLVCRKVSGAHLDGCPFEE